MLTNDMKQLKDEYMDIAIPKELDFVVKKTLKECGVNIEDGKKRFRGTMVLTLTAAACLLVMIIAVNTNQAFAKTASDLPIIGEIVKVITFREYTVDEKNFKANIKVPSIQGLKDKNLEDSLNEKYLNENKKLYEEFMSEMADLKKEAEAHKSETGASVAVTSGYEVKTDNDLIFSVERYVITQAGDTGVQKKFDTIDKQKQILITLPSLFKDGSYVDVISKNLISQMRENMLAEPYKIYWIDKYADGVYVKPFQKILDQQDFYINKDSKLVISFNKGDLAPAVMGDLEFIIPTDVINNILVGHEYIR